MASLPHLVHRVRQELGDLPDPFQTTVDGDGRTDMFDLPVGLVSPTGLKVWTIQSNAPSELPGSAYTFNYDAGVIDLVTPLPEGTTLFIEGTSTALFSDAEIENYVREALLQHTYGTTVSERYRDANGFIRYTHTDVTIANLPPVEELLVAILAAVEALWALSTDASTDIDVSTAEGTFVPRSQRYAQIRAQIDVLTEKYQRLSQQLNVGLFRIEIGNLRRVSRTTNRLVPIYVAREYDDHTRPTRVIPPIDRRHEDVNGPSSPGDYP